MSLRRVPASLLTVTGGFAVWAVCAFLPMAASAVVVPPHPLGQAPAGAMLVPVADKKTEKTDKSEPQPEVDLKEVERRRQERIQERLKDAQALWPKIRRRMAEDARKTYSGNSAVAMSRFRRAVQIEDRTREKALAQWFRRLQQYSSGARQGHLVVLQIGDSHTAGDYLSAYLRHRFQARFGDGGRGLMPIGVPYSYFRMNNATATQSEGWLVQSARSESDPGPFGISGYTLTGEKAEDALTLTMDGLQTFSRLEIEFIRQPDGGSFTVEIDDKTVATVTSRSRFRRPSRLIFNADQPARKVRIRPKGDGPVQFLSWSTYKKSGLVYVNLGLNGETAEVLERWNPVIARWQLRHLRPDLILMAFGTNEGFDHKLKLDKYTKVFTERLAALRSWAPQAAIVIVGAPDAARLPSWCARGRVRRERFKCHPLSRRDAQNYSRLIERRSRRLCHWHAPPMLAKVRALHRRIARQNGLYFWDWSRLMGQCGMDRWARLDEPLAYRDRVHLQIPGYDVTGEALFQALTPRGRPR